MLALVFVDAFDLDVEQPDRVELDAGVGPADKLRGVLDPIGSGHFSRGDAEVFRPPVENLTQSDPFLVLADYVACQERVSAAWQDLDNWTRMAISTPRAAASSPLTVPSPSTARRSGMCRR